MQGWQGLGLQQRDASWGCNPMAPTTWMLLGLAPVRKWRELSEWGWQGQLVHLQGASWDCNPMVLTTWMRLLTRRWREDSMQWWLVLVLGRVQDASWGCSPKELTTWMLPLAVLTQEARWSWAQQQALSRTAQVRRAVSDHILHHLQCVCMCVYTETKP